MGGVGGVGDGLRGWLDGLWAHNWAGVLLRLGCGMVSGRLGEFDRHEVLPGGEV